MSVTLTSSSKPGSGVVVHEPHRAGIPPLGYYFSRVWLYRHFTLELARSRLRASNSNTFLGQAWHILNPLLLALVYFVVWGILRGNSQDLDAYYPISRTSHLTYLIGGLFLFFWTQRTVSMGTVSITGQGGLLMNTTFPRMVLPLAVNVESALNFGPMLLVYFVFHLANGFPLQATMVMLVPLFICLALFNLGLSLFLSTVNVYFQDVASFVPYLLRVWLYLSPIIWTLDPTRTKMATLLNFNPFFTYLTVWNDAVNGFWSTPGRVWAMVGITVVSIVIGGLVFLSREADFGVRV